MDSLLLHTMNRTTAGFAPPESRRGRRLRPRVRRIEASDGRDDFR